CPAVIRLRAPGQGLLLRRLHRRLRPVSPLLSRRTPRPSLAGPYLMEEFPAVIADSVVLTLISNRVVAPEDFLTSGGACQPTESGRKKFFQAYEARKSTLVSHPVYGYRMSYSRMLEVQARMLASYVRGEPPAYTGFIVR